MLIITHGVYRETGWNINQKKTLMVSSYFRITLLVSWHCGRRPRILSVCVSEHTRLLLNALWCVCDSRWTPTVLITTARESKKKEERQRKRAHQAVSVSVWLCPETWGWGDSANPERLLNNPSVSFSFYHPRLISSPSFFILSPSLTFISLSLPLSLSL